MLQFKKPKKKKSLRKKEKLDLDALEAEAIASGLGPSDLGSRKDTARLAATSEQEKATAEARKNTYQAAIEKAEAATRVIREGQVESIGKTEEGNGGDSEPLVFGDDYEDLQRSVEQSRKLAMKKQEEKTDLDPLKAFVSASEKKGEGEVEGEAAGGGGKVVITEMEEFVWGLQLKEGTSFVLIPCLCALIQRSRVFCPTWFCCCFSFIGCGTDLLRATHGLQKEAGGSLTQEEGVKGENFVSQFTSSYLATIKDYIFVLIS